MSVLLRRTFVELHSRPLLQQLQAQLQQQLDEAWAATASERKAKKKVPAGTPVVQDPKLPPMPPTGDLNLKEIYRAEYFFS